MSNWKILLIIIVCVIVVSFIAFITLHFKKKTENMTVVSVLSLDERIQDNVYVPLHNISLQHGQNVYHNFIPNTIYSIIECDKNSDMRKITKELEMQPNYAVLPSQKFELLVDINPYNTENIFGLGGGRYSILHQLCVRNICMDYNTQQIIFNSEPKFAVSKKYKSESPHCVSWTNVQMILLDDKQQLYPVHQNMFILDNTIDTLLYQLDGKQGAPYPSEYYTSIHITDVIYDDKRYNIDTDVIYINPLKLTSKDFVVTVLGKKFIKLFGGLYYTFNINGDIDEIVLYE